MIAGGIRLVWCCTNLHKQKLAVHQQYTVVNFGNRSALLQILTWWQKLHNIKIKNIFYIHVSISYEYIYKYMYFSSNGILISLFYLGALCTNNLTCWFWPNLGSSFKQHSCYVSVKFYCIDNLRPFRSGQYILFGIVVWISHYWLSALARSYTCSMISTFIYVIYYKYLQ